MIFQHTALLFVSLALLTLAAQAEPSFVGNETCAGCHSTQITDWTDSHHDLAMQEASDDTVLGDFDNAKFVYEGVTTTFYKKDGSFWVETDNEKGQLRDYPVKYVFGAYPLQQLLLPTKEGSLNALSVASILLALYLIRSCLLQTIFSGILLFYFYFDLTMPPSS